MSSLPSPRRLRGLFVSMGTFSHSNAKLLGGFAELDHEIDFDTVDVVDTLRERRIDQAKLLAAALRDYGLGMFASKARLRYSLFRTLAFDRFARGVVQERMAAVRYDFTLQTQSVFSASTGLAPNYIYTDHVALARSKAAWDDRRGSPSATWAQRERDIYHEATHVFTFGSGVRDMLVNDYGLAPDSASRAGCGASARPTTPPDTGLSRYTRREILFVGVEWERKGGPELVAAFRSLRRRLPDARLTIVGCSPEVSEPGVEIVGRVPLAEVERYFQRASCFCMPSLLEPFGVVFVESLHFGLPIVATTVGDIADVVREGVNGHLTAPADPAATEAALFSVLVDPERCRAMGAASLASAPDFTWRSVAGRIAARLPS